MKKNLITRCLGGIGVGFLCLVASSCKEQPAMMVNNEYKVLKVSTTDKTLSSLLFCHYPRTSGHRHLIRRFQVLSLNYVWKKGRLYAKDNYCL